MDVDLDRSLRRARYDSDLRAGVLKGASHFVDRARHLTRLKLHRESILDRHDSHAGIVWRLGLIIQLSTSIMHLEALSDLLDTLVPCRAENRADLAGAAENS